MNSRPLPSATVVVRVLLVATAVLGLIGVGLLAYGGQRTDPDASRDRQPSSSSTASQPSPNATTPPAASPSVSGSAPATAPPAPPGRPIAGTAAAALASLVIAPESSGAYDRSAFLASWLDADGNGCDTRREVLIAESRIPVTRTGTCTVTAGQWLSYVDGVVWTDPADVDIDHTVPLKEAFESGAAPWTAARRSAFANDLGYDGALNAITDNVNASKGDRDPAEWMPPSPQARCEYGVRYVAVKARWSLSVDPTEHAALANLLAGACGARPLAVTLAR